MHGVVISEAEGVRVTSYGNDWAYTVEEIDTGRSYFLQDESAALFRDEVEQAEAARPDCNGFAFVVDHCGYDALFQAEGVPHA